MLTELRVRDLATIADVTLDLGAGLNVLTGETGAGKSMLVDALALLLGERAASGRVRPGAGKAIVEGAFESLDARTRRQVEALGLDVEEARMVVRREISTARAVFISCSLNRIFSASNSPDPLPRPSTSTLRPRRMLVCA